MVSEIRRRHRPEVGVAHADPVTALPIGYADGGSTSMSLHILLAEDDPDVRFCVREALVAAGHQVVTVEDGATAVERLSAAVFDLVVSDIRLPGASGLAVFRHARQVSPRTEVILMTSFAAVADAVAALKQGAYDYLTKPFEMDELMERVGGLSEKRALQQALDAARTALAGGGDDAFVGGSPAVARLLSRLDTVAASDASVLVTGETGTGKELVARRIHARSPRRTGPFVAVNCAAFPEGLLEAELFGHEKGAFTGAVRRREGRFRAAHKGTLLLDEVAEMPLPGQAKLLRALQEGVIEPLGSGAPIPVDVRIVAATHRDLRRRIAEGLFREDLYYRLAVVSLHIPPLRERPEDLPLLVQHFLRRHLPAGAPEPEVTLRAWQALSTHAFPGNVRELGHAVQHGVILARGGPLDLEHLPDDIARAAVAAPRTETSVQPLSVAVKQAEREHLRKALAIAQGKRARAAELLGISRKNLWEKLRAHGLSEADGDDLG
jgi:DNA-binding NtrC family response regulator